MHHLCIYKTLNVKRVPCNTETIQLRHWKHVAAYNVPAGLHITNIYCHEGRFENNGNANFSGGKHKAALQSAFVRYSWDDTHPVLTSPNKACQDRLG